MGNEADQQPASPFSMNRRASTCDSAAICTRSQQVSTGPQSGTPRTCRQAPRRSSMRRATMVSPRAHAVRGRDIAAELFRATVCLWSSLTAAWARRRPRHHGALRHCRRQRARSLTTMSGTDGATKWPRASSAASDSRSRNTRCSAARGSQPKVDCANLYGLVMFRPVAAKRFPRVTPQPTTQGRRSDSCGARQASQNSISSARASGPARRRRRTRRERR